MLDVLVVLPAVAEVAAGAVKHESNMQLNASEDISHINHSVASYKTNYVCMYYLQ